MAQKAHSSFRLIGAVAPSSVYLSRKMAKVLAQNPKPMRVLEVGAGTGSVTKEIIKNLKDSDKLDSVELMPNLFKLLKKNVPEKENVFLHCADIIDFNCDQKYDVIISSLPFNALKPFLLRNILQKLSFLGKPQFKLIFFEYVFVKELASSLTFGQERIDYLETRSIIDNMIKNFQEKQEKVWINFPPAIVRFLNMSNSFVAVK